MNRTPRPLALSACSILSAWSPLVTAQFATTIEIGAGRPDGGFFSGQLGSNTLLNIFEGGVVGSFSNLGPLDGTGVNILVNVNGGSIANNVQALSGATVNLLTGQISRGFTVFNGAALNVLGGSVAGGLVLNPGGILNLTGGSVGDLLFASVASQVRINGSDFALNGNPVSSLPAGLPENSVFTVTLADGSAVILTPLDGDFLGGDVTLVTTPTPPRSLDPIVLTTGQPAPGGLTAGQSLLLGGDASTPTGYPVVRAELSIAGGTVGDGADAVGSLVTITDGQIGEVFDALAGTTLRVLGGQIGFGLRAAGSQVFLLGGDVGPSFRALVNSRITMAFGTVATDFFLGSGSTLTLVGGSIGDRLTISDSAQATILGGSVGGSARVDNGGTLNIAGGSFGPFIQALQGSTVNIFATDAQIGGIPLDLPPNSPVLLSQRNGQTLTATLIDGSTFDLTLGTIFSPAFDFIAADAVLTITRVTNRCPPVDLAPPFGSLDASDQLAFLVRPDPTFAEPLDVADIFDVIEFINLFTAGCP